MKKVRVAVLASEFYPQNGGAGTYAIKLVQELVRDQNYEVHVITPSKDIQGKKYDREEVLNLFGGKIRLHNISKARDTFFYNIMFQLAVLRNLPELQKKYKFDVIHVTSLVHMPDIFLRLVRWKKVPTVVTAHTTIRGQVRGTLKSEKNLSNMGLSEIGSLLFYPYIWLMEKIYVHTTRHLVLTSHYNQKYFSEEYGFKGKTYVTHTGIDVENFNEGRDKSFSLGETRKPIITFVGRLISQKGINLLIESAKNIQQEFSLVFAGSGNQKSIENKLREAGVKNYKFLGFIDQRQLAELYSKTDIYVLPSFYEDFPNTILEAMSLKVPIIASKINGIPEMINSGEEGVLFEAGNVKELQIAIENLLKDKHMRVKMGEKAFKRVNKEFTITKMAEKTKKIYLDIMRTKKLKKE